MVSSHSAMANSDARGAERDEVMHRTRGLLASGEAAKLVVVNISATGMMARCETTPQVGDTIRVLLPILGETPAKVRWALGGRVGCEFETPIGLAEYYGMLSTMLRSI